MLFSFENNRLCVRNGAELLWIEPHGAGIRVRATHEATMPGGDWALDRLIPDPSVMPVDCHSEIYGALVVHGIRRDCCCYLCLAGLQERHIAIVVYTEHGRIR